MFFNHAGGVGKTSSVRDIGFSLSSLGYRVLLIDTDPQANLTEWLGITEELPLDDTIYSAVIPNREKFSEYRLPSPIRVHGLDLIPSTLELTSLESSLVTEFNSTTRLKKAVAQAKDYDFVLIDPPPSLGHISAISVIAADHVIVPLPTNSKGLRGIRTVQRMTERYSELNPHLGIAFFVLTQFDSRTKHDQRALAVVKEQLSSIAPVSLPLSARPATYKDAQIAHMPIPSFRPLDKATREINQVTHELLKALKVEDAR